MGAEQSTESQHPNGSEQQLPPGPPPAEMEPISKKIPIRSRSIGRITSAVAIDDDRPTAIIATDPDGRARANEGRGHDRGRARGLAPRARGRGRGRTVSGRATIVIAAATTDPAQDAALAEPSPPQDTIRKLTYGQLLARAFTMKGQLAKQREDERQAHEAEVERLMATAQEELRAQRAELERVREQLARANARAEEAAQALAARVDAGTASQREQKAAAAKKAANEKAAAAKKAVDEKAAADKAAAE